MDLSAISGENEKWYGHSRNRLAISQKFRYKFTKRQQFYYWVIYPRKMKIMFTHTSTANLFFFDKDTKAIQWRRKNLFSAKDVETISHPITNTKKKKEPHRVFLVIVKNWK